MEDMARLALVEQSVRDIDKFNNILYELLRHINNILENPHDYNLRTINSDNLKEVLKLKEVNDYLKYVGFETAEGKFVYPSKQTLSNLRVAQAAIERKISYCFGNVDKNKVLVKPTHGQTIVKNKLSPVNVLNTRNPFLLKIQELFNDILSYEDEALQELAREKIPIVTLQLMALDRVREHQAKIKKGDSKEADLPFDMALLMELTLWFKHRFFTWVDKPNCETCGAPTVPNGLTYMTNEIETCRVELYKCTVCGGGARFARHNDVRTVVGARRGRCGEWASAFTLLSRALGYDTRYLYDTTDHVWCEVYDYESRSWVHVDPCEAALDRPLLYSHGWGKQLAYVIAVSRDDLQDVTWRYTTQHKQVLERRTLCSEGELISSILRLRDARQQQVSGARREYLAKRTALELVQLMVERTPGEGELSGRISGGSAWRRERGEGGAAAHTFNINTPGTHHIRYCCASDEYEVCVEGARAAVIPSWAGGVFTASNVSRKVEHDWKYAYLAREEGSSSSSVGVVSWRVSLGAGLRARGAVVRVTHALYSGARVRWTAALDGNNPQPLQLVDNEATLECSFNCLLLSAELSGGSGSEGWQHAQLFRQPLHQRQHTMCITVHAHTQPDTTTTTA